MNRRNRNVKAIRPYLIVLITTITITTVSALSAGFGFSAPDPTSGWVQIHETAVRLVSATRAAGSGQTITLGLHFRLEPGWRVYWQTVEDTFLAPRIDLQGSENVASANLSWPVPERITVFGHQTLAYQDEIVLPLRVSILEPTKPVRIRAKVTYLACSNLCVPSEASLNLDLPIGPLADSEFANLITQYSQKIPGDGSAHGLSIEQAEVIGSDGQQLLHVTTRSETPFQQPDLLVGGPLAFEFSIPDLELAEGGREAVFLVAVKNLEDRGLGGQELKLILVDGDRRMEEVLTAVPNDS